MVSALIIFSTTAPAQELDAPLPVDSATDAEIEPALLPANNWNDPTVEVDHVEPPLPTAEGSEVFTSPDEEAREVSPMPRRFRYAISVDVRGVYDDNVTLSRGANRRDDFYIAIAPQVTAGVGDVLERQENFISLNYAPTGLFFFDNSEFSTIEQVGRMEGQWRINRVTLGLSQDFQSVQSSNLGVANTTGGFSNQANLDIGGRRRVIHYSTHFTASAPITGKTSLRAAAHYSITDPEDLIGSETLSGSLGVDYRLGPKVGAGLHFTGGKYFVDDPSPDQTFQQINVLADYELTGKLSATGSAGIEFRQSDIGNNAHVSPVFAFGIGYAPFDGTQIDVSATRRTLNSATAAGQDFTSTQLVVTARQRFLQRIYATLSAGYQEQSYFSTISGVRTNREDNYYFIAPGFDVRLTSFWFAGAFYTHRANDSSVDFFSFDTNQYGVRTTFRF
ncbi:MAG: hypothetical protein H0V56_00985 [Chthoniobacterales bacterium]|nr:hypothetical protein [Chthoniobacterales bacterium]